MHEMIVLIIKMSKKKTSVTIQIFYEILHNSAGIFDKNKSIWYKSSSVSCKKGL